jgi:hypothetical protein
MVTDFGVYRLRVLVPRVASDQAPKPVAGGGCYQILAKINQNIKEKLFAVGLDKLGFIEAWKIVFLCFNPELPYSFDTLTNEEANICVTSRMQPSGYHGQSHFSE